MHRRLALMLGCAVVATSVVLVAQDVVKVNPAHYKVISENASVRVMRVSYEANGKSAMHSHPDSVVIVLKGGKMQFIAPDGTKTDRDMADHTAMYSPAGSHSNHNQSKTVVDAVLVEFKTPKPGTVVLPAARPNLTMTTLAEGPRAVVYKVVDDGKFSEPAGTRHDYDQVVVSLTAGQMSLSIDGKPAKTNWAPGDVQWIGRGTPHEAKNTTGKPTTFAIVAIR